MKLHIFCPVALATAALILTGCRTPHKTVHLSNGYEEVTHKSHSFNISDDEPIQRVSFQYVSPEGKLTRIWPSLNDSGEIIHGDTAVFVGDESFSDHGDATLRPRLFAVKAPALPLDLTDEILAHWARDTANDPHKAVQLFNGVTPEDKGDKIMFHLEFLAQDYLVASKDWPMRSDFEMTWDQFSQIMETVKTKGIYKEDPGFHSPYIGSKL